MNCYDCKVYSQNSSSSRLSTNATNHDCSFLNSCVGRAWMMRSRISCSGGGVGFGLLPTPNCNFFCQRRVQVCGGFCFFSSWTEKVSINSSCLVLSSLASSLLMGVTSSGGSPQSFSSASNVLWCWPLYGIFFAFFYVLTFILMYQI